MSTAGYLFKPEQYSWLVRMADAHNMGFTNKTLNETVDYALKYQRRAIDGKLRAAANRRAAAGHAGWKRVRNCRLSDRVAVQVQRLAAAHRIDFMDALAVIVGDASARIARDAALEERVFETPRSARCTTSLMRDLKRQRQRGAAAASRRC